MESEHEQTGDRIAAERARLQRALAMIRTRQDKALTAKLDGEIPEELWQRNQTSWQAEALKLQTQLNHLDEGEGGEEFSLFDELLNSRKILIPCML